MQDQIRNPARYRMEDRVLFVLLPLMLVVFVLAVLGFGNGHLHVTGIVAYLLAIVVELPNVAFIVIFGRYLSEEKDEFQRNLLVQSLLWAIGATLTVTTFWGVLVMFDLVRTQKLVFVLPLFGLFFATAKLLLKLRYR
jgi:hypothetical protein